MKLNGKILFGAFLLSVLLMIVSCGASEAPDVTVEHTHSYGDWITTKEPTCLSEGERTRKCGCNDTETSTVPKLEHSLISVKAQLPTCEDAGYTESSYCSACGETVSEAEVLPPIGHTPTTIGASAPTCTVNGYTESVVCSTCDKALAEREAISPLGHDYDTDNIVWSFNEDGTATARVICKNDSSHVAEKLCEVSSQVVTECGCETVGVTELTATVVIDGESYHKTIEKTSPKKGHTREILAATEPTCLTEGKTEGEWCSTCEKVFVEQTVIEKKPHTELLIPAVAPSCKNSGSTEGVKCTVCDTFLIEPCHLERLSHSNVTKTVSPTCTESGYTETECILCRTISRSDEVAPLGHTETLLPGKAATCTESGLSDGKYCTVCKATYIEQTVIAPLGHKEGVIPKLDPTCESFGLTEGKKCLVCNEILIEQTALDKADHSYITEKILPTCTEKGYTKNTCSYCSDSFNSDYVVEKGHTEVLMLGKEASCIASGKTDGAYCSDCGTVITAQTEIPKKDHTEKIIAAVPATCESTGLTEGKECSFCGEIISAQMTVPEKGHRNTVKTASATCTEYGYTESTCLDCGNYEKTANGQPTGHTAVKTNGYGATCTDKGLTDGEICSVCLTVLKAQIETPIADHTYEEKVILPTCTERGYTQHVCTHCYASYTDTYLSPKGHTVTVIPGVEPTCTASGLTEGSYCSGCGEVYAEQTAVAVKQHRQKVTPEVKPTCIDSGYSEEIVCPDCSFVIKERTVIPKTDHSYTESVISPSCTESGYTLYTCSGCLDSYKDSLSASSGHNYGDYRKDEKSGKTLSVCPGCNDVKEAVAIEAVYNGGRLFTGSRVYKSNLNVTITLSDGSKFATSAYTLADELITSKGTNAVTVTFGGLQTIVTVEAIIDNVAGTTPISSFTYKESSGAITITAYSGTESVVIVPAHVNGVPVTAINASVFKSKTNITSLTIPGSVTTIGKELCVGCTSLTSLTLNEGLSSIGSKAFAGCPITELVIPDSVTEINCGTNSNGAFEDCVQLRSVIIGDGLGAISNSTFNGCSSLKSVVIGNGVGEIGTYAFGNCSSLTDVTFGNNVFKIGAHAFYKCAALKEISLPERLLTIGTGAFMYCASLEELISPATLTDIDQQAFANCTSLSTVTLNDGLKKIGYSAFDGSSIKEIYIPDSVTRISSGSNNNDGAFEGCAMLESVVIGNGLATVEGYTFKGCTMLKSVIIGNGTTKIDIYAFSECSSLTDVFLGESLITIANYAFYKCTLLESIIIPNTVQTIGDDAFYGCTLLKDISIGSRVQTIGKYAFRDCSSLKSVLIPASVQTVGTQAFKNCTDLVSITIEGGNLSTVSNDVIEGCTDIKRIYFLGTEEEWSKISINSDNIYPLNGTPYFYSMNAPESEGNYWHYDESGKEKVWNVTDHAYKADAYTEELLDLLSENESYAEQLVDELSDSALFVSTVVIWESGHIISSPSHLFEGGYISRKDLYKLALYDVLGVDDNSAPVLFANCEKEAANTVLKVSNFLIGKGLSIYELKKVPASEVKDALKKTDSFGKIGASDAFELIVSKAENAYDAIVNLSRYIALASMSDQIEFILTDISESTTNSDLRDAAREIANVMKATCAELLIAITEGEYLQKNFETLSNFVLDKTWDWLVKSIPGASIVQTAIRGVRFLAECSEFEIDGMVQAFYQLQINVNIEKALGRYVENRKEDFLLCENREDAKTYVSAMQLYEDTWLKGYDYVVSLYTAMDMSEETINGVKEKKAMLDTWFADLDVQIEEAFEAYVNA